MDLFSGDADAEQGYVAGCTDVPGKVEPLILEELGYSSRDPLDTINRLHGYASQMPLPHLCPLFPKIIRSADFTREADYPDHQLETRLDVHVGIA
jgi:hypothetical protein